jgi:acetyl-CoA synthetase
LTLCGAGAYNRQFYVFSGHSGNFRPSYGEGFMSQSGGQLDTVMQESRLFPPPAEFVRQAQIKSLADYEQLWNEANNDIEAFWGKQAKDLHWFEPYQKVLDWKEPFAKWFVGGKTNASYNCLDAHLTTWRKNKAAIIWEGEPGDSRTYT